MLERMALVRRWMRRLAASALLPGGLASAAPAARPPSLILLIGDGLGPQQLGLLLEYSRTVQRRRPAIEDLLAGGELGTVLTGSDSSFVTDSAAAATALATGYSTLNHIVGLDRAGIRRANLMERAAERGLATGVVTTSRVSHATPAGFMAHVPNRYQENRIADQIVQSKLDLVLGGGLRHFLPKDAPANAAQTGVAGAKAARLDRRDLLAEARIAVVHSLTDLAWLGPGRVLGLLSNSGPTMSGSCAATPWPAPWPRKRWRFGPAAPTPRLRSRSSAWGRQALSSASRVSTLTQASTS
jgi:alkaline phosphatase